jgi:peptidyl-prolyl cis-trans isomerase C
MISAPGITVNGVKITIEQINSEVQYHPAPSLPDAKYQAMQALVIRELLIQQAIKLGLCDEARTVPCRMTLSTG